MSKEQLRPLARPDIPLSHYAAKYKFKHIIQNGVQLVVDEKRNPLDLVTYLEFRPGIAVLAPALNGNFQHDRECLFACLSTPTVEALAEVARRGGDALHPRSIGRIARLRKANILAVQAYFGILTETTGRQVGYDEAEVIPVDATDGDLLAVLLFTTRHFAGCKVMVNIRVRPEMLK